jgi:acyl dehydratase
VHADDVISYRATVTATRPLASRPGWGLLTFLAEGHAPGGQLVMSFEGKVLVQGR